ncbi:glycoside hydrolase [Penicillium sp. DV-2018c]|nr:glycoside hydrolase [Penicillium sp. DV-2018c]KAJ5571344.1 glycoside hydrolase [Penicillium sp. DV-2018c]
MASNQTETLSRFAALKKYGVEIWISVGGWAMNDPGPWSHVFSELAASTTAQKSFIDSLKAIQEKYDFDGIDLDWEYPVAPDRFGTKDDYVNFVSFLKNVRSAMGSSYGLSITLPSSYWYLQYFDIVNLAKTIDWFNFMSYDIYGTWDATIESIGSYVYASTNLTMIDSGLKLLWHNDIPASQVNLGLGFYGRSYTLEDPSCVQPGCPFKTGGKPGPCTQTEGILSYDEIQDIINDPSRNPKVWLDAESAVKIAVYDGDQWVAYDDPETLQTKEQFANSKCMEGVFVWAVDQDVAGNLAESISNATDLFPAGGSGEQYVTPDIWKSDSPELSCQAPCTFILPPFPLPTPAVVTWPPVTTSLLVSVDGGVSTTTTTIPVPDFQISAIPLWPVTIANNKTTGVMSPVQSITPPSIVITLPGSVAPFPPTTVNYTRVAESQLAGVTITPTATTSTASSTTTTSAIVTPSQIAVNMAPGCTKFYQVQSGDSCWSIEDSFDISASDFEAWNPDVGDGCANGVWLDYYYCISHGSPTGTTPGGGGQPTTTGTTVIPVFYTTSHPVTIQPQATHATVTPKPPVPPIDIDIGPPKGSSNKGGCDGCGKLDCGLFGCDGKCGLFGCDGGCGLWWCGGGCGLGYCGPGCGTGDCIITGGGGGGGSTGSIGPNKGENQDCDSMETADICTVYVKSFSSSGMASSSTTTTTYCAPTEGCSVTASTTTTTISTTGTYSTITNSFMLGPEPTMADSVLMSISASIVSQRKAWDATRWSGYTITIHDSSTWD